jgi:NADPH-dependent 2,4-dienoyl-CoA reductase/sulfur reductase-like enzyme
MTRILDHHVRTHDVDVRLGTSAEAVRHGENGSLVIDLSDGTTIPADVVVMAAGARPNADLARDAGLEIGRRGGIVVDALMRTSDPDILAAGDAVETAHFLTGEPVLSMLAGPANREGRITADTICGRDSEYRGTQETAVVKVFDMTAGGTGMTETELRAADVDFRKVYTHQNGHAAYYPGTAPLFMKVLFDPREGKLQFTAYANLILEMLKNDPMLFIRGDEAEEAWRIIDPVMTAWSTGVVPMQGYAAGQPPPGPSV